MTAHSSGILARTPGRRGPAAPRGPEEAPRAPQSQTLDRGIRLLQHLAEADAPRSVNQLAQAQGLHRSIVYRLLRTFSEHGLVERDPRGRYALGLGVTALARGVRADLQTAALPRLSALVAELGMTAFVVVRVADECVTVLAVEPPHSAAHVSYRPGNRHPVSRGAPGLALLMAEPATPDDLPALGDARRRGWATSTGEVVPGVRSVAAPIPRHAGAGRAAVAVVFVGDEADEAGIGAAVAAAATEIGSDLR